MTNTLFQWITDWFAPSEGSVALTLFRVISVVGLGMAFLQLLMRMTGWDHHDTDVQIDGAGDHDGVSPISWTTLAGFALGFGSIGSIVLEKYANIPLAAAAGAASGLGVGALFYFIMRGFSLLKEDNTFNIRNTIGQVGTAYIRIPARAHGGQVQVVAQSRMVTLAALCDEEIASGEKVRIIEVIGADTVRVERA